MGLSAATIHFLAFISSYLNQCPLYDKRLYNTACDLQQTHQYDFIVVGGGSSGTVVASRLSENPNWNVLLIEVGGVPSNLSDAPSTFLSLQLSPEDWQFKTEHGPHCLGLTNQRCNWPQGKVIGGGSTINAMLAIYGHKEDYDYWQSLGLTRWGWDTLKPYYDKAFTQMKTTTYKSEMPTRNILLEAAEHLGFPINDQGVEVGYEDVNVTIYNNRRHNSGKGYIVPANTRTNLCVMTRTQVERLLYKRGGDATVIGVQLTDGRKLYADKEVIMAAGAINTPKLLMLSGIGPKAELQKHNIPLVKDLPGVGQNLMDHLMFPAFFVKLPALPIEANDTELIEYYCSTGSGPVGQIDIGEVVGWINTRNSSRYAHPDMQFMHITLPKNNSFFTPSYLLKMGFNNVSTDSAMAISAENTLLIFTPILSQPRSRGQIVLADANISTYPLIHPGYLTDEYDVQTMLGAIRHLKRMVATPAFQKYKAEIVNFKIPLCDHLEFNSDEYWVCSLRNFGTTLYHATGTCKMGYDEMSVINEDLEVYGVQNLRIVDGSILPKIVTGNTNLPVITHGEYAADIIKSKY